MKTTKNTLILSKSQLKLEQSYCSSCFVWQHICYGWWTCFSTYSRHSYGYQLCTPSRQRVPLFIRGSLHMCTRSSQENWKEAMF